MLLEHQISIL